MSAIAEANSSLVNSLHEALVAYDSDGRTISEIREAEPHYDLVVDRSEVLRDGLGNVVASAAVCGGYTYYLEGCEAVAGDTLTIWDGSTTAKLGSQRHGFAVNGVLKQWQTPFERVAQRVSWFAQSDRNKRERLEAKQSVYRDQLAKLNAALRERIEYFAASDPGFWLDGGYELFCCTEADKFIKAANSEDALKQKEEVEAFWADRDLREKCAGSTPLASTVWANRPDGYPAQWLLWFTALNTDGYSYDIKRQYELSGMDEGHSGNTFSGAIYLATRVIEGKTVTPGQEQE